MVCDNNWRKLNCKCDIHEQTEGRRNLWNVGVPLSWNTKRKEKETNMEGGIRERKRVRKKRETRKKGIQKSIDRLKERMKWKNECKK